MTGSPLYAVGRRMDELESRSARNFPPAIRIIVLSCDLSNTLLSFSSVLRLSYTQQNRSQGKNEGGRLISEGVAATVYHGFEILNVCPRPFFVSEDVLEAVDIR